MELNESARVPEVIRYIKGLEARVEELEAAGDPSVPEEYPDAGAETPYHRGMKKTAAIWFVVLATLLVLMALNVTVAYAPPKPQPIDWTRVHAIPASELSFR
jgi:tetrahydromethanopterin S-methyltransferase subunit B